MKYCCPLLVVESMDASKSFYKTVLGLSVVEDLGENVTLTGGISLQTKESYIGFISNTDICFGGNDAEIYFEEEYFDLFLEKLNSIQNLCYVHKVLEHSWGQRAVRFYDPDMHIIEVGESMRVVCMRFLNSGMTIEQTAKRMDVSTEYVQYSIDK